MYFVTFLVFFLAFYFCRFRVVIRFFHPRHNAQWPPTSKDFYTRSYPLHNLILILEKEPVFLFSMLSAKQGNYLVPFFKISLVWHGPWLGIEPVTSRTRCQHSTTRLSRRRCDWICIWWLNMCLVIEYDCICWLNMYLLTGYVFWDWICIWWLNIYLMLIQF